MSPNLFYDEFQQVTGGGLFAREQREDDRLKHSGSKEIQPGPHYSEWPAVLSRSEGGEQKLLLLLLMMEKVLEPILEQPTPPNASVIVSTGPAWKLKSSGSAKRAPPFRKRHRGLLPSVHFGKINLRICSAQRFCERKFFFFYMKGDYFFI